MKHSILIALPLAAALMAPAYAQQDNSNNSSQSAPAAQSQSSDTTQQQTADTGHQPLTADRHEGFWGKLNPFARKKYVQRQMDPIRGRVNELDQLTATNAKNIKDVDSRAQEGIRMASAKANEADQHAIDAGNRAQTADQTAQQANSRLQTVSQVVGSLDQYQVANQTELRLRPGQSALSKKAKDALDQLAESVKGQNAYLIEVQGFSNGKGTAAVESSQQMAQSVVRYLVLNHEIPLYRIYLLGMGNAKAPASAAQEENAPKYRGPRVEVSLLKNPNLEQLNGAGAIATPGASAGNTQGGMTGAATQQPQAAPESNSQQQPASNMNSEIGRAHV